MADEASTLPFRRRLELVHDGDAVEAELEDHIHHVAVRIVHDGTHVTEVHARPVRLPWSLCPAAAAVLQELVGAPIGAVPVVTDSRQHCTHLLDVARFAVRFAGDPAPRRRLDVEVEGWDTAHPVARVHCDPPSDHPPEVDHLVRRATWMAAARGFDLDEYETLEQVGLTPGSCYASQPDRIGRAVRVRSTPAP